MTIRFSDEEEAFREVVVSYIASLDGFEAFFDESDPIKWALCKQVLRELGTRNWLALSWPKAYGGEGLPPAYESILWDEFAYARVMRPPAGAGIVAKALIAAGTDEQRNRFLEPIRRGELQFILGYSEPEAGSDLTGLRTRAVKNGENYVLNGEKRWSNLAHMVDKFWVLCRTGTMESRARGLSVLIVDADSPGVTVSPIPVLDGGRLNEIRFSDVIVPVENRIGEENAGWAVVSEVLAVERHVKFGPLRAVRDLEEIRKWATTLDRDSPEVHSRLRTLAARIAAAEALSMLLVGTVEDGRDSAVIAAAHKLYLSELCQEIARIVTSVGSPDALIYGTEVEFLWRQSILETIGGGTSEIMRGIVARKGLNVA
jgi:alkylation response protein AidB-like acyl-CoA dehydrogenase